MKKETPPKKATTKQISLRLKEQDYKYLRIVAYMAGQNPSSYLKLLADASINALKLQINQGKVNLADFETVFNDKL
jgi:major membrane immunogen (membrane-anchored lipoprotein)